MSLLKVKWGKPKGTEFQDPPGLPPFGTVYAIFMDEVEVQELKDFLVEHKREILELTENKTLKLAGARPSSEQLKRGLPIFFRQLLEILKLDLPHESQTEKIQESALAKSAGLHGNEMLRLGYSLSQVVHAYGAMCQSITELANREKIQISSSAFHNLNQCLDVAIAGAVSAYQLTRESHEKQREITELGFLAHELRNALASATISLQLIKKGTVGVGGSTGSLLENSLKRIETLVDRSLMEVRLNTQPEVHVESGNLLRIVDQLLLTAEVEAESREQKFEVHIDPTLTVVADLQAFHSALSNLIQNALKFTPDGGMIQIRGSQREGHLIIEVEDECGGLLPGKTQDLFAPFKQGPHKLKGLGLGLSIAQRAMELNHGTIQTQNLQGKGCIFSIILPQALEMREGLSPAENDAIF